MPKITGEVETRITALGRSDRLMGRSLGVGPLLVMKIPPAIVIAMLSPDHTVFFPLSCLGVA